MNPSDVPFSYSRIQRQPNQRPAWTPESFKVLIDEDGTPTPLIIFANFYIHCLWPDKDREIFESLGSSSNNYDQLPWNINYDDLCDNSKNKWFPHIVFKDLAFLNIVCCCNGLCPYKEDFKEKKNVWISLYNRLFTEAFQNPYLQIRKCPTNGLGIFSRIQNLSLKYNVAPHLKVNLSMFLRFHRKGLDKFYFTLDENTGTHLIYIPYWIGSVINFANGQWLPNLHHEFIDEFHTKQRLQYVFQYIDYQESLSTKVTKVCTIDNNVLAADRGLKERYEHIIIDDINIIEDLTNKKQNEAVGITTEVLEGCSIYSNYFEMDNIVEPKLNINEELLLATGPSFLGGYIQLF